MNVGDLAACMDCDSAGVIVCTDVLGSDFDQALQRRVELPLEPSAYEPPGLTCRACEASRFRGVLPVRGACAACGRPNAKAIKQDLGATRSFCGDACVSTYVNRRLTERS